jgi:uncharacterized membrane protein (UPF0136 family)
LIDEGLEMTERSETKNLFSTASKATSLPVHQGRVARSNMKTVPSLLFYVLVAASLLQAQVLGFASVRTVSNTTRNLLMTPLRLDQALGLSAKDTEPRGVALNSGVGGLVFAGGLMGFVKKGSKASLMAGSTFGGLLMLSAYLISKKSSKGNVLGSGVAGMLTYAMGKKFMRSGKFMPAGLIAGLGAVAFCYNLVAAWTTTSSTEES